MEDSKPNYYWRATPVGNAAELLTLFWRQGNLEMTELRDVPLVSVLRDTLGDSDPRNDHISYVWLLTSSRPSIGRRILSAAPFFYWSVGQDSKQTSTHSMRPLIDLNAPEHPAISALKRDILQWAVLDQHTMGLRAVSRAYRTNQLDDERLHLEETISYLRSAPVSENTSALTREQLDTLLGRLELRKHLLGGLVNEERAARFGKESDLEEERVRGRNWELLRQCAEKTGLLFESLNIAGTAGQYGVLWFPLRESPVPTGFALDSIWKLLNIKNPWRDKRLQQWKGVTFNRALDENGSLLAVGASGGQPVLLVPLGVYGLSYPKQPLLLVDFRDKLHGRRYEIVQRGIEEVASGVLGISRFTNWYYYVAADLYEFIAARHGSPMNQAARLDCYSRFRVALALDQELDPLLRKDVERRLASLNVNPLVSSPASEVRAAVANYARLQVESGANGGLLAQVEDERRNEIASLIETRKRRMVESLLSDASFGLYKQRSRHGDDIMTKLDCYRRVRYELSFLDSVVEGGPQPEILYDHSRLHTSITELSSLMTGLQSSGLRTHAERTIRRLGDLSQDVGLQTECALAAASLRHNAVREGMPAGIITSTRTVGAIAPVRVAGLSK